MQSNFDGWQNQLGFPLKENIAATAQLKKVLNKRADKEGPSFAMESSENVWNRLQGIHTCFLKQEREIEPLKASLHSATTKVTDMQAILRNENVEVEAMRVGYRQTE